MFNTYAIMSKVDLKVRVGNINLLLGSSDVRETDTHYFVKTNYPPCELFNQHEWKCIQTVFRKADTIVVKPNGVDEELTIGQLMANYTSLVVTATIQHGMYGTILMDDVKVTLAQPIEM